MNPLHQVYTFAEAAELWGLGESTLRSRAYRGEFLPGEARKSGKTWLVTDDAMRRIYGVKKEEKKMRRNKMEIKTINKEISKYGEWVKGFEFENANASGEYEICITKGGEGYIVTVNSSSDMPGFTTPKCIFNEEYQKLDLDKIVDDLHRQDLEDLSNKFYNEVKDK